MFKNLLLKLLLLGIVVSLVIAEEKAEEKHDEKKDDHHEDEHDEEHEKITPHKDDEHEDDHEDKKDDDHHDDDHDDKKDDEHHDDDEHDEKKDDDHDDEHEDKKDDDDDDEGDHDDPKDDVAGDEEDSDDGGHPEHDAFLGDQLTAFQDLQDEDAKKKKLQELVVNEVDTNKDGFVTEDEIRARLIKTTKEQRKHEMNNTMITHDDNKDGKVSWDEFKKHHFTHDKDDKEGDKEQMEDDEAKFKHADVDGDGGLNLDEYISFYHPGDDERMSAFVIGQTLKKYDADKDGVLSKEEYLKSYKDLNNDAKTEITKDFDNTYDLNKDGKLEVNELSKWLFPDEDMSREEPPAMMKEVDDNKDGKLSMEEILKNYKVFVDDPPIGGSDHDEL